MPDEKSQKPREMVHRSQTQCAQWLHQLRRSRQGLPEAPELRRAEAELHDAVMILWEQIKRFSHRENIEEEWHHKEWEGIPTEDRTLESLRELRLGSVTTAVERKNPETGVRKIERESQAWVMDPGRALAVLDALDHCANTLGFDAEPVPVRKSYGYEEVELDEEAEQFLPQPVPVPDDD